MTLKVLYLWEKILGKTALFHSNRAEINSSPPACGRQRTRNKGEQKLFVSKEGAVGNIYAKLVNINMTHSAFKTVRVLLIALPL